MDRIIFIEYKGKSILLEDLTNLGPGDEYLNTIETAKGIIASQPLKSVLALLDATNVRFNSEMLDVITEFVKHNTPFIKSTAVVGITGLLKIVIATVSKITGRNFNTFQTREEAMEYLSAQQSLR